ncbi:glycoside hydrolase family 6 protein [Vibrio quintilis]|uniref:Glucanase n=1 Tax=Vibrio quintilis TaxID=1117707 RepID=A0A1M7YX76_9VIBR|nr:glycoside hydrolase family 6 protein [Vibrio quintilis]SHO57224.1 Exoglucanase A precursor [Vibrio quintilis]
MKRKQRKLNRIIPLLLSVGAVCSATAAQAACEYSLTSSWPGGYQAAVKLTNDGSTDISSWEFGVAFPDATTITNAYSGDISGTGPYTISNSAWNGTIKAGESLSITLMGAPAGSTASTPELSGDLCSGTTPPTSDNTAPEAKVTASETSGNSPLAVSFDASGSTDPEGDALTYSWTFGDGSTATGVSPSHTYTKEGTFTATVTVSDGKLEDTASVTIKVGTSTGDVTRVDNPFAGTTWYVNPEWAAKAEADGGSAIAGQNTFVWMDRIAAIEGTDSAMGLKAHLDNALAQGADLFTVVIYDLPNRDCRARASNGELTIADGGMDRYKAEYIDPIAAILADPAYKDIHIVTLIELDSLPNLVTNIDVAKCKEAAGEGGYKEGITYALNAFSPLKNVYSYIDAAHSGWLGWDSNFDPAVNLISGVVTGTDAGWDSIAGFITNTANYTPTVEPYLQEPYKNVGGQQVRSSTFYEWNPYFDEKSYAQEFRKKMIAKGAPSTIGMLIDTSRNGWGGSERPSSVSTSSDLDTYVDESRIDRRLHRGNWCNQPGGIGYKPYASPYPGIDAFVWAKPPGESDGISESDYEQDPDDPAKQYDSMCDPDSMNSEPHSTATGAMDNAPHAGRWFSAGFKVLLDNAYPSVDTATGKPE